MKSIIFQNMNTQAICFLLLSGLYLLSDKLMTWFYKRKYRKNPDFVYKNPANALHKFLGRMILVMQSIYVLVLIYHLTQFDFGGFVGNMEIINYKVLWITGLITGSGFILLSVVSRLRLGSSWRVGIDKNTSDDLITTGIYRWIRNPFFASALGFQFSLILISPGAVTILNFILGFILFGFQARSEEVFLESKYGEQYLEYKNKTGRFIPRFI